MNCEFRFHFLSYIFPYLEVGTESVLRIPNRDPVTDPIGLCVAQIFNFVLLQEWDRYQWL